MRSLLISAIALGLGIAPLVSAQDGDLATTKKTAGTGLPLGKPGPGMVWVNANKRIYYRQGDAKYGKSKKGTYMSEGDALNNGYLYFRQKPPKNK